jgi:rhamnose transport system ATP-binding protein
MRDGPLLDVRAAVVRYGATTALDAADLDVQRGEVHAVVGENGAGKSTLLRVIAGAARLATGRVIIAPGTRVAWVPQETELPPDLTATEWIFLARELRGPLGWLRRREMHDAATMALRAIGSGAAPTDRLGSLSLPQRKQVQLARALHGDPNLLLLDEPTAVLGEADTRRLFSALRALRERGAGILYVSHRLEEVLAIADRVTVLRDGRRVSTDAVADIDVDTLVQRMVGRELLAQRRADHASGGTLLHLADVAVAHVRGLSLTVRRGEVVGLAGLVGAGRSEVLEAIAGLRRVLAGRIELHAVPALVPEDRNRKGLVPTLHLRENMFLGAHGWLLRPASERNEAQQWIGRLAIRCRGPEDAIDSLSGGNQQKLLLARALRQRPQLLLLDEPTAGVDVGAKAEIHDLIAALAASGTGILLASSDLPELLALCDQIVALRAGTAVGVVTAAEAGEPMLAAMITGAAP